jgi:hypothetical protein
MQAKSTGTAMVLAVPSSPCPGSHKGLRGGVLVLSSVADFTIPLVSSVRIELANRVLLVQANTRSCVVGEPEWGGRSSAGAV